MKKEADLPPEFVAKCKAVTAKRARTALDHVLKNGFITSQELKDAYGYNHPPRAIRDVKENGIPMEMFRVAGTDGRSLAAYQFGDPAKTRGGRFSGRMTLGKQLRDRLVAAMAHAAPSIVKPSRSLNCKSIIGFLSRFPGMIQAMMRILATTCCYALRRTARNPGLANTAGIGSKFGMQPSAPGATGRIPVITNTLPCKRFAGWI